MYVKCADTLTPTETKTEFANMQQLPYSLMQFRRSAPTDSSLELAVCSAIVTHHSRNSIRFAVAFWCIKEIKVL